MTLISNIHTQNTIGSIYIHFEREMLHDVPVQISIQIEPIQKYHCVIVTFENIQIAEFLLTNGTLFILNPKWCLCYETFFNALILLKNGKAWKHQEKIIISNGQEVQTLVNTEEAKQVGKWNCLQQEPPNKNLLFKYCSKCVIMM